MFVRAGSRLSRRSFLAGTAALAGSGLALRALHGVRADDGDTVTVILPDGIGADEHWVDVSLGQQVACAMTGGEITRVILATSGQPGYETPTGQFRILYRVANETMRSDSIGIPIDSPNGYDLDNVLWTQYFTDQGHALHDNYWRPLSVFGHTATSHGCVGMLEPDARFLWNFVGDGSLVNIHA
jgi:lipoprotein-anchoring transpeptidase ErfK/SrfK